MLVKLEGTDMEAVSALDMACFEPGWDVKACENEVAANPFCSCWGLKEEGKLLGYVFLWETFELAQIARIAVDPSARGRGLGRQMLREAMAMAREHGCEFLTLECRVGNGPALALYKSEGLEPVNRVARYYGDGEDAFVLSAPL